MQSAHLTQPRACETCSRAKAKCTPGRETDKCSRCQRLQKPCVQPARKQRKKRAPGAAAATTAGLERKIESLVALLSHGGEAPSSAAEASEPPPLTPAESPAAAAAAGSDERAGALLQVFRAQFANQLPMAVIGAGETWREVRAARPWVFRMVMVVAGQEERARQMELGAGIARDLVEGMMLRGERNVDMLLALLMYNAWSGYFSSLMPQVVSAGFAHLAIGMLVDLGLHRPSRVDESGPAELERWALADSSSTEMKRTMDERRALLGCFLVTSTPSHCIKRIECLQSSPYLEYTCQAVLDAAESDADIILVYFVRLHCLIESISRAVSETIDSPTPRAPIWMHVAATRTALENIWSSVPLSVRDDPMLRMKYYSTQIFVYDSCLQKHLFSPTANRHRLDMLYACLLPARAYLDLMLEQPLSIYLGISVIGLAQLGHALSTLIKLSFVDEDGWVLADVRPEIALPSYLDRFAALFEQAGDSIDSIQPAPCKVAYPTGCSRAMRRVRTAYDAKIAAESDGFPALGDGDLDALSFEHFDDAYWESVIGDFAQ